MLGLTILHLKEEEFWKMTPRKFYSLVDAYVKYNTPVESTQKSKSKPKTEVVDTTIDNIDWW